MLGLSPLWNGQLVRILEWKGFMQSIASVVSLGCAKNLVDSEGMVFQLQNSGYGMSENPSEASLILVNTCGFLESAVKEAIDTILELAEYKTSGSCRILIVAGCMVQRYGKKLPALLPEVDIFIGTAHFGSLKNILEAHEAGDGRRLWLSRPDGPSTGPMERILSSAPGSAYLKIADGCSNRCSFCLIPHLRGPYRSRRIDDILAEASGLVRKGVREINIVAQDTTAFGSDKGAGPGLPALLEKLEEIEGLEWLRVLYTYPERIDDALLSTMARSSKIVPYLDVPLQHCVPRILSAMRRESAHGSVERTLERIRSHIPGIALRTSLIVGFPGETNEDFQELCRFVERVEFNHLGVFGFSPEPGTKAAKLPMQIPDETKEERKHVLLALQKEVSRQKLRGLIGKTMPVLVEGPHPETDLLLVGRLPIQAPEVDGTVLITKGFAAPGVIAPALITASHEYDLEAELLPGAWDKPLCANHRK